MSNVIVIGSQWGDEGKGKIVDWLSYNADAVVRFQGGHNAGHTLVVNGITYKLNITFRGSKRKEIFYWKWGSLRFRKRYVMKLKARRKEHQNY